MNLNKNLSEIFEIATLDDLLKPFKTLVKHLPIDDTLTKRQIVLAQTMEFEDWQSFNYFMKKQVNLLYQVDIDREDWIRLAFGFKFDPVIYINQLYSPFKLIGSFNPEMSERLLKKLTFDQAIAVVIRASTFWGHCMPFPSITDGLVFNNPRFSGRRSPRFLADEIRMLMFGREATSDRLRNRWAEFGEAELEAALNQHVTGGPKRNLPPEPRPDPTNFVKLVQKVFNGEEISEKGM